MQVHSDNISMKSYENAYVVVDMQKAFNTPPVMRLAERVSEYLQDTPEENIYATVQTNPEDSPFRRLLGWVGASKPEEHKLLEPLQRLNLSNVYQKTTYDGAKVLPLSELKKYDNVYLIGVDTDACVLSTAFNLFDENVNVKIVENMTLSHSNPINHSSAIRILQHALGRHNIVYL